MPPQEAEQEKQRIEEAETGLPGLRSWRAVYLVVLGFFAAWIAFLTILPRLFS